MEKEIKQLFLTISALVLTITMSAQNLDKGYHGFVESAYSIGTGTTTDISWVELNTIHGYQATPYLFVGAGVGFHFTSELSEGDISGKPMWKRDNGMEIPVFADFRWTVLNKKITPFVDLRLGHNISNDSGMYSSIGAGCRFVLKENQAIYALLSYTTHNFLYEELSSIRYMQYKEIEDSWSNVSLKIGFEF